MADVQKYNQRKTFAGVMGLTIVVAAVTWVYLNAERNDQAIRATQARADAFAKTLKADLTNRKEAAKRMASRIAFAGQLDTDAFLDDAQNHLDDMPGNLAMSWLDNNFIARSTAPITNTVANGRDISAISPDRRRALFAGRDSKQTTMTDPVPLLNDDGIGFLVFEPVFNAGQFMGGIVSVFSVETWLKELAPADVSTSLTLSGEQIFASPDFASNPATKIATASAQYLGNELNVALKPRAAFLQAQQTYTPEIGAMFAGILTLMGGLLLLSANGLRNARIASIRDQDELEYKNAQLRDEVLYRKSAEAAAKKADDAKSRFLAVMSHEIRTPLNAIMGMFELIERADIPERQKRQAVSGHRSAERLFAELTKVLDVSRLDAEVVTITPTKVRTNLAIEELRSQLSGFQARAGNNISTELTVDPAIPESICIDLERVSQILTNLLDNAFKFTESGQVSMHIHIDKDTDGLIFDICDTGPGISKSHEAELFKRFYQIDNGVARRAEGSGLGLSISKEVAALLSGTLSVRPNSPKGSIFTLTLYDWRQVDAEIA